MVLPSAGQQITGADRFQRLETSAIFMILVLLTVVL